MEQLDDGRRRVGGNKNVRTDDIGKI